MERINEELARLEREEALAEDLLLERREQFEEQQRQINEALARISRLRKLQRQLRRKGVEMVRRGHEDLETMEEADRKAEEDRREELGRAQRQEAQAIEQMQQACSMEVIDWSSFSSDPSLSEILGEVAQGSAGGAASAGAGSSSGV